MRLLIAILFLSLGLKAQDGTYVLKDTLLNVDIWTHLSRKQLPDYILPEEKDSIYCSQLKRIGKNEIMVYLVEYDQPIDSLAVTCTFFKNKITFKKEIEYRGIPMRWGRAKLKRKMYFNNYISVRYISKSTSREVLYLIWPGLYKKTEVDRVFPRLKPYGL